MTLRTRVAEISMPWRWQTSRKLLVVLGELERHRLEAVAGDLHAAA